MDLEKLVDLEQEDGEQLNILQRELLFTDDQNFLN